MSLSPKHRYLIGFAATGNLGPFVVYTSRRQGTVWYVKPKEGKFFCWKRTHQRNRFRHAAMAWKSLPQEERNAWNLACRLARLYLCGYALYTWWQTKRDRPALRTIERQSGITLVTP